MFFFLVFAFSLIQIADLFLLSLTRGLLHSAPSPSAAFVLALSSLESQVTAPPPWHSALGAGDSTRTWTPSDSSKDNGSSTGAGGRVRKGSSGGEDSNEKGSSGDPSSGGSSSGNGSSGGSSRGSGEEAHRSLAVGSGAGTGPLVAPAPWALPWIPPLTDPDSNPMTDAGIQSMKSEFRVKGGESEGGREGQQRLEAGGGGGGGRDWSEARGGHEGWRSPGIGAGRRRAFGPMCMCQLAPLRQLAEYPHARNTIIDGTPLAPVHAKPGTPNPARLTLVASSYILKHKPDASTLKLRF